MSGYQRFTAMLVAAGLAVSVAGALNLPVWRDWPPGDGTDLVVGAVMLVWVLTMRAR